MHLHKTDHIETSYWEFSSISRLDNTIKATQFVVVFIPFLTEHCQEVQFTVSNLLETIVLKVQLPHTLSAAQECTCKSNFFIVPTGCISWSSPGVDEQDSFRKELNDKMWNQTQTACFNTNSHWVHAASLELAQDEKKNPWNANSMNINCVAPNIALYRHNPVRSCYLTQHTTAHLFQHSWKKPISPTHPAHLERLWLPTATEIQLPGFHVMHFFGVANKAMSHRLSDQNQVLYTQFWLYAAASSTKPINLQWI